MKYTTGDMFGIADRTVVITGGCGGIGYGLAEGLSALGAKVALLDINQDQLRQKAAALAEQTGNQVIGYAANITDEESVNHAFEQIEQDFGSVYGLINCAGISYVSPLAQMPIDRWAAVMDVNVKGTLICSKVAGRYMARNHEGRIINISSLAATHGKPGYTAYTPSKAAINGLTFTLAAEWGRLGINVNSVSPVMVVTDINRAQVEQDPDYLNRICSTIPQGRICSPELLCGTMVFLLSEASSYVTGQNIGCDGGCQNGDISVIKPPMEMEA